jgi:hypothetical protein
MLICVDGAPRARPRRAEAVGYRGPLGGEPLRGGDPLYGRLGGSWGLLPLVRRGRPGPVRSLGDPVRRGAWHWRVPPVLPDLSAEETEDQLAEGNPALRGQRPGLPDEVAVVLREQLETHPRVRAAPPLPGLDAHRRAP